MTKFCLSEQSYIKHSADSAIIISFEAEDYLILSGRLKEITTLLQKGFTKKDLENELRKISATANVEDIAEKIIQALFFMKGLSSSEQRKESLPEVYNFGGLGKLEIMQFGPLHNYNEVYALESSKKIDGGAF